MNPRKYPRTLNEAFGPYTGREFTSPPMDWQDKLVLGASVAAGVAVLLICFAG